MPNPGNQLGSGRSSYYPATSGRMNEYQIKAAVNDNRIWKMHLIQMAPEITRKVGLYDGPDWNRGETIVTEPGRPSHLFGPTFPWPENTHSRYKLNQAQDGIVFDMEGKELVPPRGEHNPKSQYTVDPRFTPPSGEGFIITANKDVHMFWDGFWLADADAIKLIIAMKQYATARRKHWEDPNSLEPDYIAEKKTVKLPKAVMNTKPLPIVKPVPRPKIRTKKSIVPVVERAPFVLLDKQNERVRPAKVTEEPTFNKVGDNVIKLDIKWGGRRGFRFRKIMEAPQWLSELGIDLYHKTGGFVLAPGNRIKAFGTKVILDNDWLINNVLVVFRRRGFFCKWYEAKLSDQDFDLIQ